MRNKLLFVFISLIIVIFILLYFIIVFTKIDGSYLWYSEPSAITHTENNSTYIGLIDNNGNIKVLQHKNNKKFLHYIDYDYQKNEHDHPVFLILPDNRIMLIYSKHNQKNSFNYKVSKFPNNLSIFTDRKNAAITQNSTFTYPNPFILPENPTYLSIFYRGLNWQPTLAKYTLPDEKGEIKNIDNPVQIIQSEGRRPYAKYILSTNNKIYMAYTTGHADEELPNYIYFSVIDLKTLNMYDIAGNYLYHFKNTPFKISKNIPMSYLIVDNTEDSRNCIWDIATDKNNNPIIAFVKISPDKQIHTYFVSKWDGKKWIQNKLADGGSYFHGIKGTEETFSAGLTIDKDNPDTIYASVPIKGLFGLKYEIVKYVLDDKLNIIKYHQITKNSVFNNIRPLSIKNYDKIIYLNGKYYYWKVDKKHKGYPLILKEIKK